MFTGPHQRTDPLGLVLRRLLPACLLAFAAVLMTCAPALASSGLKSSGPVQFGSVDLHFGGSPRQQVQVENVSGAEMLLGTVAIEGAQNFSIVQDYCSDLTLGLTMSARSKSNFSRRHAARRAPS